MNRNTIFIFFLSFVNCILTPPPITFTQSQTAAEKQMVGEDKELEKDGWLISSIKTSSSGSDEWKKDSILYEESEFKDKDYSSLLGVIAYLAPEVKTYRTKGVLGEGLNGLLQKPAVTLDKPTQDEYSNPEKKKRVENVMKLINDARVRIYETRMLSLSKTERSKEEQSKLREKILLSNYYTLEAGEYYESSKGNWIKK
ncbi:MAG TPA: DUF1318 domain-containing protein [Leptospiraceae bacterium]|nr:DUF1318 domain-containing protein [Leptospiraceae bacterium]HMW07166.1 DUF1318 domain-containing protein [Leptospiraceae bacterium]HMX33436.1 DUF1318 domain-containing protein [Leptospiraceae bacterium]HMY32782.1 DUF1318 domain-containing protein [Leptospiraceae bacterium]HMZ65027.1 DUF1318 domain-containing protein [Leptospiraceae bacterium]